MEKQAYTFIMFILNGIIIGLLFDIFRISRKTFKTSDIVTYIEDLVFWILTGLITLYFIFTYNNGEIRLYIFLGILFGVTLYMLSLSKYIIKCSVKIILTIKNIILKGLNILLYPFKLIFTVTKRLLFRPFSFICININNFTTKIKLNISNILKKCKIFEKKHV